MVNHITQNSFQELKVRPLRSPETQTDENKKIQLPEGTQPNFLNQRSQNLPKNTQVTERSEFIQRLRLRHL